MKTLQERLQWALARKPGATQADLARACKVKAPSVTDWFSGKTKSLKADSLRLAASFLGVNRDWLQTGLGDPLGPRDHRNEKTTSEPAEIDSPKTLIEKLGDVIAKADPISRAAIPALLNRLASNPEEAAEIGRKLESILG